MPSRLPDQTPIHRRAAEDAEQIPEGFVWNANYTTVTGMRENRIYNALRIPLETESQIAAMNRSPHVDSRRIKAYLQAILAEWPERLPD